MLRSAHALALCLIFLAPARAFAQENSEEVPPVAESSFAAKSINDMNADEVLQLVRYSYTVYNRNFKGELSMGITKKVEFQLSLKPDSISYLFDDPPQIIFLETKNRSFTLLEGIGGAAMKPVDRAKFDEKIRGTDVTYDDLSMRFLYWPNARIMREEKMKGRQCILISIPNPDGAGAYSSVDVWIDKLSGGMVKMIGLDQSNRPIRRFEVLSGKKFDDVWMVNNIRIETVTGPAGTTIVSSTRLQIKASAP
ncbi:MAG: outer membrane lipoprotein-sorting protein [Verrucomicrobiales bacterium]